MKAFPTSRITLTVPLRLGVSFANYCWSRSKIVLAGSAFAPPIGLRQSMRRAQKIKTNIVAPQMRATTVGIFGITWIPMAIWVRPLVLWCQRCCPGMRSGRTGRRWLGGFTTICRTPANSGPKLAAFNLRWSANPNTLPSINTYVANPHTGDKRALVKEGVATLSLEERKAIIRPWLASLG